MLVKRYSKTKLIDLIERQNNLYKYFDESHSMSYKQYVFFNNYIFDYAFNNYILDYANN